MAKLTISIDVFNPNFAKILFLCLSTVLNEIFILLTISLPNKRDAPAGRPDALLRGPWLRDFPSAAGPEPTLSRYAERSTGRDPRGDRPRPVPRARERMVEISTYTITVNIKTDKDVKEQADRIFSELGLNMTAVDRKSVV